MSKNKSLANAGSILAIIGGILQGGAGFLLWISNQFGGSNPTDDFLDIFNKTNWLGYVIGEEVITAVILMIVGAIIIVGGIIVGILLALGRFGLSYVVIGIILIILGLIGSSLAGLLILIGGILFLVAGL